MTPASTAEGTADERRSRTNRGAIAAANVGIFAETNKRKRRFVPNLRAGGRKLPSLAHAGPQSLSAGGELHLDVRRRWDEDGRGGWVIRNFSMLSAGCGVDFALFANYSQEVTRTFAIFFAPSRPVEAPDFEG